MRILIAGVGNVLRGDDGFGVAVAQALCQSSNLPNEVTVFEGGIAGIALVQELMQHYDALIVADAMQRGGAAGTIYVIEPDTSSSSTVDQATLHATLVDAHYTEPSKVLLLAKALGVLPPQVFIIGCEPAGFDELGMDLSDEVKNAVPIALKRIESLIETLKQREMT